MKNLLTKENIQDIYQLSPMQQGIYFHYNFNENTFAYVHQVSFKWQGRLDVGAFKTALDTLIELHDSLRTVFIQKGGHGILQVVLKEKPTRFHFEDLREETNQETYLQKYRADDFLKRFDLKQDVLNRISIFKINDQIFEIIWTNHHIVMDGWSCGAMVGQLIDLYEKIMNNQVVEKKYPTQYKEYIKYICSKDTKSAINYWKKYLEGISTVSRIKPLDSKVGIHEKLSLNIDKLIVSKINQYSNQNSLTINSILQTVWGLLIATYTDTNDIVFGSVISTRPREVVGSDQIIGLCINTLPVRLKITPKVTFLDLAQQLQNGFWESYEHQHISLADIQATTSLKSNLISHLFIFENYPISENLSRYQNGIIADVRVTEFNNYGLYITAYSNEQGILLDFEYDSGAYTKEFINELSCRFQEILNKVLNTNESSINHLLGIQFTEIKESTINDVFEIDELITEDQDNLISQIKLIWEKILEQDNINTNDNYFDIGGHSLNLVRLFTLIDEQFPNAIKIPDLFDNPTIISQAKIIRAKTIQKNTEFESGLTVLDF